MASCYALMFDPTWGWTLLFGEGEPVNLHNEEEICKAYYLKLDAHFLLWSIVGGSIQIIVWRDVTVWR
nr:hypothetical protein Iba_chr06bCG14210 [Ipomoea batatas]GME06500.1 hypothetical protein Iba_scaffold4346CG0010 [Ipomoea batatas]